MHATALQSCALCWVSQQPETAWFLPFFLKIFIWHVLLGSICEATGRRHCYVLMSDAHVIMHLQPHTDLRYSPPWNPIVRILTPYYSNAMIASSSFAGVDGNPIADSLLHHLQRHSATSRIISALTVTSWLHASDQLQPPSHTSSASPQAASTALSVPSDVVQALFGALAAPAVLVTAEGVIQPYAELTAMYSAMQQHAQV